MSDAASGPLQFNTTQDERTMGLVCGLLAAFTGFLGPLIIMIVRKDSVFVKLCAMQAVIWHLGYMVIVSLAMMAFFFGILATSFVPIQHGSGFPLPFVFFPFFWGILMLGGVLNLALGIFSGVKANEGIWWPYPIAGRLAKRFLGV